MKKRAIFYLAIVMFLLAGPKTISGQDTIIAGSFPSAESLKSWTEEWKIISEAFQEQLKTLHINSDSFRRQMEIFNEQMKDFHLDQIVIPNNIPSGFENYFNKDAFATTVNLKGESKTKEVVIDIEKEIPVLLVFINGGVKSGNVSIGIYDPNGKKQGGFSIENDTNGNNEVVNGSINKRFSAPIPGKWKVKVDSDKAFGNIFITSMQKP